MFNSSLVVKRQTSINASPDRIWFVLTDPSTIARYLYGASVITDWGIGSEILFQGEFDGTKWEDKGVVREYFPGSKLAYDYWSGSCGLADLPENYAHVSFSIESNSSGSVLVIEQKGYASQQSFETSGHGWEHMLSSIKSIAEE